LENNKIKLIVIAGATASGKTAASLELAKSLDIEIISADSRQVYKHLNIGTAKPEQDELATVPHHFIDFLELNENYSAGEFGNQAYQKALEIHKRGKIPVVVGGSGLYIKGLCEGFFDDFIEEKVEESSILIRKKLQNDLENFGIDYLYNELNQIDKRLYDLYSDKNPRRILRALEFYYKNGISLSEAQKNKTNRELIQPIYFAIDFPREKLYERINLRVEKMWQNGLVEETKKVLALGYSENLNSLNTVGYKETIAFLKGKISEKEAISEIQKNTRHYAKRQLTWFKKITDINFLFGTNSEIVNKITTKSY
jgi:tRNA dimethylallyltransferase